MKIRYLGERIDRLNHCRDSRGGTAAVTHQADQEDVSTSISLEIINALQGLFQYFL
jgi:hypothetical protein